MKFKVMWYGGMTMKERKPTLICLILLFSVAFFPSNVIAEGDDIVIESNMTWTDDLSVSQNVRIVNGGELSFSDADVNLAEGVEIFVDADSTLNIDNSRLISSNPPGGLVGYGYCDESNRSGVKIEWPGNSAVLVTMTSIQPSSFDGVTAYFDNVSEEMSGQEYSLEIEEVPSGELWIDLVGPLCHPPAIDTISVKRANSGGFDCPNCKYPTNAADFEHRNMMVFGTPGFEIIVEGKLFSSFSEIFGGRISSSGSLTINDSALNRVGPVILTNDDSSIMLTGETVFYNSTDDHDIRARAFSSIEWAEDVSGSGGLTDKWERRVSGQRLTFDSSFVSYEIEGMHRIPRYSNFSDQDGVSFVDGGRERVVEIAWSEDNTWEEAEIWREQAEVIITDYRTAWNPEASGIGDYGGAKFPLLWESTVVVDSGTPMIGWVSISSIGEDGEAISEAEIGDSVNFEAVISNSGTAAASLAINCDSNNSGSTAQISPSFPNTIVGPGEEASIVFSWRSPVEGVDHLSCTILTPTQLVEELSFGGGTISSAEMTWSEATDENGGGALPVPVIIAMLVAVIVSGFFLFREYNE